MNLSEGKIYHIFNRGNKQQNIFFEDEDYELFLKKVQLELRGNCDIIAYCLMPNHFHLVVQIRKNHNSKHKNLNNAIGTLLRSYTRVMQGKEHFKGSLFQQKTKAKELGIDAEDPASYLAICTHYLHLNPKRAGLAKSMADWKYSSLREYLNKTDKNICNRTAFYLSTNLTEEKFVEDSLRLDS